MNNGVVRVSYDHIYDLYFRVRHVKLEHMAYRVDFMEWIKAGVAFNVRGIETSTRKISYFGDLYTKLTTIGDYSAIASELGLAVTRYYEDLFWLYQDHLIGVQNAEGSRGRAVKYLYENLVLIPSFKGVPLIQKIFPEKQVDLLSYKIQHEESLQTTMAQLYVNTDSLLYKCMGMYYDHGLKPGGDVVLLGVNECQIKT